jgi:hypothetical protein
MLAVETNRLPTYLGILVSLAIAAKGVSWASHASAADRRIGDRAGGTEPGGGPGEVPWTIFRWNSRAASTGGSPGWDEPLASDRPDFTEASSTVGDGVSQLEMGYTYFLDGSAGNRTEAHSYPELLLRQGLLADWLELRVGWSFNSETQVLSGTAGTVHGADDLYLGVKLGLTPQQDWLPEMALTPQALVPLGGPFSAGRVLPGINWLYGWDVSERVSTGGSTQYNLSVDELTARLHGEFAQSWTIGISLAERLSSYTEWFVLVPSGADTEHTEHYFDGGLTYRWTNNLQSDMRIGKGVSRESTDFFAGVGMVLRF